MPKAKRNAVRLLSLILALACCLSAMTISVFAQGGSTFEYGVTATISNNTDGGTENGITYLAKGSEVTLLFRLPAGSNVGGGEVNIEYDPARYSAKINTSVVSVKNMTSSDLITRADRPYDTLTDPAVKNNMSSTSNKICQFYWSTSDASPDMDGGILCSVTFTCIAETSGLVPATALDGDIRIVSAMAMYDDGSFVGTDISIDGLDFTINDTISKYKLAEIVPVVVPDPVDYMITTTTVSGSYSEGGVTYVKDGAVVKFTVTLPADTDAESGQFKIEYDTSKLELLDVAAVPGTFTLDANGALLFTNRYNFTDGLIYAVWDTNANQNKSGGTVAVFSFKVKDGTATEAGVPLSVNFSEMRIDWFPPGSLLATNLVTNEEDVVILNTAKTQATTTTYKVTYDANGATSGTAPVDSASYLSGASVTVAGQGTLSKSGYTFSGWTSDSGLIYQPGSSFTITDNVTLYAKWTEANTPSDVYYLTIRAGTGGTITTGISGQYAAGTVITIVASPNSGYSFNGWTTSNGGTFAYASRASTTFTMPAGNVTITANFTRNSSSSGNSSTSSGSNTTRTTSDTTVDVADTTLPQYAGEEIDLITDHIAYINGSGNGLVNPDSNMTRAEVAQMFYNLLVSKTKGDNNASFSDVQSGAWYYDAVTTLASLGVITGYSDNTFKPGGYITRAEFMTIASRFGELMSGTVTFNDVNSSHWAYSYIANVVARGWVDGYPDGSFRPNGNITRAEVIKVTNRMLDRTPDKDFIDSTKGLLTFTDLDKTHWAYYEIMEATNAHDYDSEDGSETWTVLK